MKTSLLRMGLLGAGLFLYNSSMAQTRYIDKVFQDVTVTADVTYGQNYQVLTGTPVLIPLQMDVYRPAGDNATNRPLIVYLHTGSFLPPIVNGSATGSRKDSATAEMCREFARRGYVVASVSYRLGWNPQGNQEVRTGTILNAVYRANQDVKTAIRFFRKETATNGNPYGIDTTKIVVVGQGTGGYAGLAAAYLDKTSELNLLKFIDPTTNQSYVNQAIVGDFDGFGGAVGVANNPNHAGYTSNFNMVINLGGAIGDTSWIEPGNIPAIAFQSVTDPFAPFNNGIVLVPGTTFQVIEVGGSGAFTPRAFRLGLQSPMADISLSDPISQKARTLNNGVTGLYPLYIAPATPQAGPWEWWDSTIVKSLTVGTFTGLDAHNNSMLTNPNMSKTKALNYIDTIQRYCAPRIVNVLGLPGNTVSVAEKQANEARVNVFPNPATDYLTIRALGENDRIRSVEVMDVIGKRVRFENNILESSHTFSREGLPAGLYFVRVTTDKGEATHKVNFK